MMLRLAILALLGSFASACRTPIADPGPGPGRYEYHVQDEQAGVQLPFVLVIPDGPTPDDGWPMLMFLHGSGERGTDVRQLEIHGPLKLLDAIPELRECVLVVPQCPERMWWESQWLLPLFDEIQNFARVDDARLYVTGLSMGGYATWGLLASAPDRIAAAVPICGGGEIGRLWPERETGFRMEDLLAARHVPIRAFHGEADDAIPMQESVLLVDALHAAGSSAQLTTYPGVGHDSWTRTYADPELYRWLFAQRRSDD